MRAWKRAPTAATSGEEGVGEGRSTHADEAAFGIGSPEGRLGVNLGLEVCRGPNPPKLGDGALVLHRRDTFGRLGIHKGAVHWDQRRRVVVHGGRVWVDGGQLRRGLLAAGGVVGALLLLLLLLLRVLLRGIVVGAGGRLARRGLLLGRELAGAGGLGAVGRGGRHDLHGRVALGGGRGLLLLELCGRAGGRREVVLVMGAHGVLGARGQGSVGIVRVVHGHVAVTVAKMGAREGRHGGGGGRCLVRVQAALVIVVLEPRGRLLLLGRVLGGSGAGAVVSWRHLAVAVAAAAAGPIVPPLAAGAGRVAVRLPLLHGCCWTDDASGGSAESGLGSGRCR